MKPLRDFLDQELQWTRVKRCKRAFELQSGDEVLAMLYPREGTNSMIVEAADGHWELKRRSFWNSEIVITELPSQAEIAVVRRGRNKRVTFVDGRLFTLTQSSYWRNDWVWLNDEATPLIHYQRGKRLAVEPTAFSLPELSLLVIAGWYLIMLQQEEDNATAAAAVAWM
jgi:hypothetical protein